MRSCWILSIVSWYAVTVYCSCQVKNDTAWTLRKQCVLATPEILFSPSQNTVKLQTHLLEQDGDKAWIGYAKEYVEFQYKGCATLQTQDGVIEQEFNTSLDLGQCYSACKGIKLFGLTTDGNSCRCLTAEILKENLKQTDCTTLCDNQSFLCGNKMSMSIYKRVFTELNTGKKKDSIHQCLSYIEVKPKTKYFSWNACGKDMEAMCIDENGESKSKMKNTWSEKNKACFVDGKYPMSYEPITGDHKNVWLGVVLTIAITKYEAPENIADYRMYGYVEKENDKYLMKFTNSSLDINMTICKTVYCSFQVKNGTVWTLRKQCVLATPEIIFSPSQNTVKIETDVLEQDGDKAWIGYAKEYVEFQYKGCANLQTQDGVIEQEFNTSLDLGQCYSACKGNKLFGLTTDGNSCRCLTAEIIKENLKQTDCTTLCDNQSFLCGNKMSMSIYKRVFTELNTGEKKDSIHQCLSYIEVKPKTKYFSWNACGKDMEAMCIDENGESESKMKNTWSEKNKACFVDGKYPMSYEPITGDHKNVWLGVVLTIAITKYEATENTTDYRMYGYVEKENDKYLMKFTNSSLDINMTICKTDSASTTGTTTNPTSSSDIATESFTSMSTTTRSSAITAESVTSMSTTTTESTLTSTPSLVTTMPNISTTSSSTSLTTIIATVHPTTIITSTTEGINSSVGAQMLQSTQDSQQSNVGVFVGVPVAILVIIGIIFAVILIWRRRKQSKDAASSSKTHHNGAYISDSSRIILGNIVSDKREVDPQTKMVQPNVYDYISDVRADDNLQTANANTYVVIEDVRCDNQTPDVTATAVTSENHGDHTYFVLEKAEKQPHYTDTPSIHSTHEDATNNSVNHVYNTAGYSALNSDKDVYDHIGGDKGRPVEDTSHYDTTSSSKQTDGTYDTTSPTKQTDGTYDTTSLTKQIDGTYDTSSPSEQIDETYDTTSPNQQTDGMYNTTKNPIISKHNRGGVYSVADHNSGNLYSQVNNGRESDK